MQGSTEIGNQGTLYRLASFLHALHNEDRNGCIIVNRQPGPHGITTQLNFVLLNPAVHFEQARLFCLSDAQKSIVCLDFGF